MKKLIFTVLFLTGLFLTNVYSTTFTITVGDGGALFNPASISNAHVGDTIKWVWVAGSHTTTSTTIPGGATTWDSPIDNINTTFSYKIAVAGTYNYKCTPHEFMGMVGSFVATVSGIQSTGEIVNTFNLSQNYPNPFNPSTVIKFSIPQSKFVKLSVYDVNGKEVKTLVNNQLATGTYNYTFNASELSSGTYFYKLTAGDFIEIKRMVLIK